MIYASDVASKLECLGQGHTIDRGHLAPHRYARCRTAHRDPERLQAPGDVERGGLALNRLVGREDHLLDPATPAPRLEAVDGEIVRPDSVER